MPGAEGQAGYTYQKDYAAYHFLASEALRSLDVGDHSDFVKSFVVEGPSEGGDEAWDIAWTTAGGSVHLRECKDTKIKTPDRKTFYRRVRKEVKSTENPDLLTIGWVTDKSKQGNILNHWKEMRDIATEDFINNKKLKYEVAPRTVNSSTTALSEAMFYLCREPENESGSPPITEILALTLLRGIELTTFRAAELSNSVSDLAGSVFNNGVGSSIRNLIQGNFDTVIQGKKEARYTRDQFLEQIGVDKLAIGLSDTYRDILRFQSASNQSFDSPNKIKWRHLPGAPEFTWPLLERIPNFDHCQSRVLVASTGDGKTTSCQQAFQFQQKHRPPIHVLWFNAGNVSAETTKALPTLCLLLCGVAPTWIAIDGLDQIPRDRFEFWQQSLDRMQTIPQLTMLISIRSEVVQNHEWMQTLTTSLGEEILGPLTEEHIDNAFQNVGLMSPINPSLRACLRNPFLFSVYALTVSANNMPLENSGEVEAFNVIGEFWKRRVTIKSDGARGAGSPDNRLTPKLVAIRHLAKRTLKGNELFTVDHEQQNIVDGIEMLCNESVLARHATTSVKWSHAWIREFAIIEYLLGEIPHPSPLTLVHAVCNLDIDHIARDAANAACKWLIAHPEVGNAGVYLEHLYGKRIELAREVLFDVMDGAERHLTLATLSLPLLIEAIELACQKCASQWAKQVSELPDELLASEAGPELARVALNYETKVPSSE